MNSLRIALLTYSTKPRGGVVHTLSLADELASLGHHVYVFAISAGESFYRTVNVPHTLIPAEVISGESMDDKIKRYINIYAEHLTALNENYDIYHSEDCISANALLLLRNQGLIKFFVRTIHHVDDFTSQCLIDCQLKSLLEPDFRLVVSKFWQKEIYSRYALNSVLIHNGVNLDKFREDISKEKAKKRFSVDGCNVMLSIGGIEPRKNTLTALRAFNIARSHFKAKGERLVWIIGGGETLFDYRTYREEFFAEVERAGFKLGEDIIVLGNIADDTIPALYAAGDVFVFPSVKEGWGLVALEAMASGLPVAASEIEPMTEYLKDGENAFLFEPLDYDTLAEGIISIIEKTELRQRLIENGKKTAESYSWRNTALKHEEFYSKILIEGNKV